MLKGTHRTGSRTKRSMFLVFAKADRTGQRSHCDADRCQIYGDSNVLCVSPNEAHAYWTWYGPSVAFGCNNTQLFS